MRSTGEAAGHQGMLERKRTADHGGDEVVAPSRHTSIVKRWQLRTLGDEVCDLTPNLRVASSNLSERATPGLAEGAKMYPETALGCILGTSKGGIPREPH